MWEFQPQVNLLLQPVGISEVSSTSLYLIRISSPFSGSIFPTYQLDHLIPQVFQLCASTPASIVSDSSIAKSSPKTATLTPLAEFRRCQMLLRLPCVWLCFLLDQHSRASNKLQSCIISGIPRCVCLQEHNALPGPHLCCNAHVGPNTPSGAGGLLTQDPSRSDSSGPVCTSGRQAGPLMRQNLVSSCSSQRE